MREKQKARARRALADSVLDLRRQPPVRVSVAAPCASGLPDAFCLVGACVLVDVIGVALSATTAGVSGALDAYPSSPSQPRQS